MTKIQVFSMRAMYSGAAFHKAYLRATQQALLIGEREHLLPLALEKFDLAERSNPRVDGLGRVKVKANWY